MGLTEVFAQFFSELATLDRSSGRSHFKTVQRESQYKIAASGRILSMYNEYKSGLVIIIKNKQSFKTASKNCSTYQVFWHTCANKNSIGYSDMTRAITFILPTNQAASLRPVPEQNIKKWVSKYSW